MRRWSYELVFEVSYERNGCLCGLWLGNCGLWCEALRVLMAGYIQDVLRGID